jgi:hypothetical protein
MTGLRLEASRAVRKETSVILAAEHADPEEGTER